MFCSHYNVVHSWFLLLNANFVYENRELIQINDYYCTVYAIKIKIPNNSADHLNYVACGEYNKYSVIPYLQNDVACVLMSVISDHPIKHYKLFRVILCPKGEVLNHFYTSVIYILGVHKMCL